MAANIDEHARPEHDHRPGAAAPPAAARALVRRGAADRRRRRPRSPAPAASSTPPTCPTGIDARRHRPGRSSPNCSTVSGNRGNTVWAAAPTTTEQRPARRRRPDAPGQRRPRRIGRATSSWPRSRRSCSARSSPSFLGRRLTRRIRDASAATQRIAAGQLSTRVEPPRRRRPRRAGRAAAQHQRDGRGAGALEGARAAVPAVGQPRPAHPADVDPRLRRGDHRRRRRTRRGRRRHPVRGTPAGTARRRPARPGQAAQPQRSRCTRRRSTSRAALPSAVRRASRPTPPSATSRCGCHDWRSRCASSPTPTGSRRWRPTSIENALKYARFEVDRHRQPRPDAGVLTVDDDGPGIAADDLPHVFERLYVARSQPQRRESSSGLGLAIVRELVEAMGGDGRRRRRPVERRPPVGRPPPGRPASASPRHAEPA